MSKLEEREREIVGSFLSCSWLWHVIMRGESSTEREKKKKKRGSSSFFLFLSFSCHRDSLFISVLQLLFCFFFFFSSATYHKRSGVTKMCTIHDRQVSLFLPYVTDDWQMAQFVLFSMANLVHLRSVHLLISIVIGIVPSELFLCVQGRERLISR